MRPPGDSACGRPTDGSYSCDELQKEPISQNDEGGDRKEENYNQREYPSAGIKNDVGAHDARDGAAGT